jgi:hypothetical protein
MLPYLIAGAIGYGIAKLLEDDKAPKYVDGGEVKDKDDVNVPLYHGTIKEIWKNSEYESYLYVTYDFEFAKSQALDRAIGEDGTPIVVKIYPNQIKKYRWEVDDDMGIYRDLHTWQDSYNKIGSFVIIGEFDIDNFQIIDIDRFEEDKAPKYTDGGSVLLAPNGKPSNLTPEQYKLVRTPEFKEWFGDWESKQFKNNHKPHSEIYPYDTIALDENGEPRIWHRATNYDYTEFDTEYIYLGSKRSYVKQYGKPKEFFIKPQKTIFIDNEDIERQKLGINFDYLAEYISDENGIPLKGKNYDKLKKAFENQKEVLSVWEYFTFVGNKEILDLFKNWFNEYGFDSVMYWETGLKNNFGKYPVGLICLYFGNEIKLADGSNTTFDSNNPDIRFKRGGNLK